MKKIFAYTLLVVIFMMATVPNYAAPSSVSEAQKKKEEIESQVNSVSKQKNIEEKKISDALKQKSDVESAATTKDAEFNNISTEITKIDNTLVELDKKINDAQANYGSQLDNFKKRIRFMYEDSNMTYIEKLISAKDLFEFYQRLEAIYIISRKDQSMLKELQLSKQEIAQNKLLVEEIKTEKQKSASETKQKLDGLLTSRSDLQNEIDKRKQSIDLLAKEEEKLIAQSREMQKVIKKLQSSTASYSGGIMRWPLPSSTNVTCPYGMRIHPITKVHSMHTGVDIAGAYGCSVVAANSGRVIVAEFNTAYGKMIVIDHGGSVSTMYAHLSSVLVSVGNSVSAGQVIGKEGSTGWSTGAHLHFEVRISGATTNPLKYIKP